MVLWGEALCGKSDSWQGRQGPAVERVLHGPGLLTAPDHPQGISKGTFQEEGQDEDYLKGKESLLSLCHSWLAGWAVGDGNLFLCSGEGAETLLLIGTCLSCS